MLTLYESGRLDQARGVAESTSVSNLLVGCVDAMLAVPRRPSWSDLSTNLVTSRLLELLLPADEPLTFERIGAHLYPDEIVTPDALQNRVNVQMSKLRRLGLKPWIRKLPRGFVFQGFSVLEEAPEKAD
jgi:hypothetical protein